MSNGAKMPGLVTIFGGSGFVGRYAVRELAKAGWRIRAASRRPDLAGHLQPMGSVGQILPVQANLRFPDSLARAIEGADAVVNCVGILAQGGSQTFATVQAKGARAVAKSAREAGVRSLVHVSAIGADAKSSSQYARSKAEGEAGVLEEFPSAGNVVVEAMAYGLPIVATACDGPQEILSHGVHGRITSIGDHVQLAHAIEATLQDPGDPAQRVIRARDFSFPVRIPAYEALIADVMGTPLPKDAKPDLGNVMPFPAPQARLAART